MSFTRKRSFTFGAYGGVDRFSCGDEKSRAQPAGDNILDILDSPAGDSRSVQSDGGNLKETELFEIIEKLQGSRINEQRCEFPLPLKSQFLTAGGGWPLIVPSETGGYWIQPPLDGGLVSVSPTSPGQSPDLDNYDIMERDREATVYRQVFCTRYHHSFTAIDPSLGPLVLSVCLEEEEKKLRLILRLKESSLHGHFSLCLFPVIPSSVELAKMLCDKVTVSKFEPVSFLKAPELITAFDEHRVSLNFKFGILYQREGQLSEEEILSNNHESDDFKEFLSILGETVLLQGFTRFRGGLDVSHGQTGSEAVFTSFQGREIMFHVATKLPFTEGDPQQLQRKRHIGNDIVALIYQEGQTPFFSDIIKSQFLHCFLVVRRIQSEEDAGGAAYQVSVTARDDVPPFGPVIPDPPVFTDPSLLRQFLLTKLINAEISCYKAECFSRLELRTRSLLLETLQAELSTRSQCMMGDSSLSALSCSDSVRAASEGSGGFIENFKRAIRVRSHSLDMLGAPKKMSGGAPQKPKTQKDGESDKSPGSLPESLGSTEVKDQASPQEEP
ncbi:rap1 GTPase-activating protein 2 isoform X1 [Cynoglossus semilaevis]|uniref:rap1 GTPase-activating protein 2 isoform X1 n=1 Tax=Cynoglossus semilaevis TaxID=244447 RepID=UPI0004979D40|nr:rap1 GTPase-activating protein 2-like isoform X1 [Cynoglossus semilaevis]